MKKNSAMSQICEGKNSRANLLEKILQQKYSSVKFSKKKKKKKKKKNPGYEI